MPNNYFALEPIIKDRLQDINSILEIYTPFSVEDMLECTAVAPSISIIYVDDRVGESAGNGSASVVYQQWLVVLCVEEASSQLGDTTLIRNAASPMIVEVLKRMQGFNPQIAGFKQFKRANAGVQHMSAAGKLWLPYLFECQLINSF
ncbi:phage tail terminator protein [Acinetobacter beijerinckii]|uniref:DUF3168 domain-containing protein n=1 Tax=Acinetobacter beijerinckii ANC 3835 TaxID=1217649 RepID=N9FLC0_9GAMM|nr:hypothetical protein [Acinetobacter beijerinckii]ENW05741.1 hypothetical protein F934_01098 [Acinetobacter beijerinckii ANC 3835]